MQEGVKGCHQGGDDDLMYSQSRRSGQAITTKLNEEACASETGPGAWRWATFRDMPYPIHRRPAAKRQGVLRLASLRESGLGPTIGAAGEIVLPTRAIIVVVV